MIAAVYIPASLQDRDKGVFLSAVLAEINALTLIYPNLILAGDFNTLLLSETNSMYHGFTTQSLNKNRCPGILEEWMISNYFCHPFQLLRKFTYEKYLTLVTLTRNNGWYHHVSWIIICTEVVGL